MEKLTGSIERVTFHSEESGFCVLRVQVRGHQDYVAVIGKAAVISPGESIEALGEWNNDKKHGLQFKAKELRVIPPGTLEGIEKYLGSGMIKGIGPHFAKVLVKAFGEKVFDVIEETPEKLLKLPGIGTKRKEQVLLAWAEQKSIREIMVFLQSHGVGTARAVRIYKTYGDRAIELVRENPYRLALDIHGIGFKTADMIAGHLGVPTDSLMRACAGVRHVLQTLSGEGHCAAWEMDLKQKSVELLGIPEAIITTAIMEEIKIGHIFPEKIGEQSALFLITLYQAELGVAQHLKRLHSNHLPWGNIDTNKAIPWVEKQASLILSESQKKAVIQALQSKLMIITGGPGVGKTTIVKALLAILRAKNIQITLCAPTGRAAKRLTETTGITAKTIHRLLEFNPRNFSFRYQQNNPLLTDLVVVDEASMLDIVLMNHLLKAIPDYAALLLIGDVDQLPSVGPGAFLSDAIASKSIPTVFLTEIFRQAASSQIIVNAHRINQGKLPVKHEEKTDLSDFYFIPATSVEDIHDKLLHLVSKRIPERFGFNPMHDIQILTPMNRGGVGTRALNIALQAQLNPQTELRVTRYGWTFALGDKVIQNVNNYDKEVYNGDIGNIVAIDLEESKLTINFDGRAIDYEFNELDELALAYATSIHKSQGSEYPVAVIPLAMQHYRLLARNLLYTAVTRGKQLVIIIGEPKALAIAVRNAGANQRLTNLTTRLV